MGRRKRLAMLPRDFEMDNKGFSLIELIIYIGLVSVILLSITSFLFTLLNARARNEVITEVGQQGVFVMQKITQTVRNAQTINAPTPGTAGVALSLNSAVFDLANEALRVARNGNTPVDLTNSRIIVSDLSFNNLSRTGTPGLVRVQFTLSHKNPGAKALFEYSKTFYGSASLR